MAMLTNTSESVFIQRCAAILSATQTIWASQESHEQWYFMWLLLAAYNSAAVFCWRGAGPGLNKTIGDDDQTLARSDQTQLLAHPVQQNTRRRHRVFCSGGLGPVWIKQSMGLNSSPNLQATCHAMRGQGERVARRCASLPVPANDNLCTLAGR